MSPEPSQTDDSVKPVTSLDDPRALQILSTEHWSLLGARSLAYNEAFVRGGMFLTFLSMSFVALALLAQGMTFGNQFLTIAAVVLAFDFIIGLTTYGRINGANVDDLRAVHGRINGANVDDLRAVHGMARIRHAYIEIAPLTQPYFTTATYDDVESVIGAYGTSSTNPAGDMWYAFTTSGGMIGLITSMVAGVLAAVIALLVGVSPDFAIWIGIGGGVLVLVLIVVLTFGAVPRHQAELGVRFPAPKE
jgi:hypothetical protein